MFKVSNKNTKLVDIVLFFRSSHAKIFFLKNIFLTFLQNLDFLKIFAKFRGRARAGFFLMEETPIQVFPVNFAKNFHKAFRRTLPGYCWVL